MANKSNLRICLGMSMFFLVVPVFAHARTITVGPGTSYDFDSIQAGIDAATDGDTVLVALGEYIINVPITFQGKAITIMSEKGPDETTIRMGKPDDADRGSVIIFENNETTESVLDGFTITGGSGSRSDLIGGGIYFNASSATVRNCAIVQNRATHGGGVLCGYYPCSPSLVDCIIAENIAVSGSEGLGGGVYCYESSITMTNCTIIGNMALAGGGVLCGENSSVTVTHCVIEGNTAEWGGGLASYSPGETAVINCTNCTIWGNSASANGGGLGCYQGGASATVTNSIFRENTAPTGREIYLDNPTEFSISYSNVAGGQTEVIVEGGTIDWGEGNIDADPLFARIGYRDDKGTREASDDVWVAGDYHLKSQAGRWEPNSQQWVQDDVTSPCIDTADPMSPIGWESFPNGGFANMGAYGGTAKASKAYFGEPICETIIAGDINGDGQVNRADLDIMALHWTDDEPLPLTAQ